MTFRIISKFREIKISNLGSSSGVWQNDETLARRWVIINVAEKLVWHRAVAFNKTLTPHCDPFDSLIWRLGCIRWRI